MKNEWKKVYCIQVLAYSEPYWLWLAVFHFPKKIFLFDFNQPVDGNFEIVSVFNDSYYFIIFFLHSK